MASVHDFNDTHWRATISDAPRYKNRKQLYYPKKHYTKPQVRNSATALEHRHKQGEIDLWQIDIHITGDKINLRQIEGENVLRVRDLYNEWIERRKPELAEKSILHYRQIFDVIISETGNFYPSRVSEEKLNAVINKGALNYRKSKHSVLRQIFKYAKDKYNIPVPYIEVVSSRAERKSHHQKAFKDFLVEGQVLTLAEAVFEHQNAYQAMPPEHAAYYFLLLFYFPRRRNDFLNLKPEWARGKVVQIGDKDYLPKSQVTELTTPDEEALELLEVVTRKFGRPGQPIFPYSPDAMSHKFRALIKEVYPHLLGKVTLHKLRDSGIMHLLYEKNMTSQEVMNITGHERLSSLEKYIHKAGKAMIEQKKSSNDVKRVLELKNKFFERD